MPQRYVWLCDLELCESDCSSAVQRPSPLDIVRQQRSTQLFGYGSRLRCLSHARALRGHYSVLRDSGGALVCGTCQSLFSIKLMYMLVCDVTAAFSFNIDVHTLCGDSQLIVCYGNCGPTEHCSGLRELVSLKQLIRA
jgi:hypothetical protein